ncbi:hypothetical protein [Haloglomus salinum]|uniref:hypothetical protein n=1 Tax=Haloglomus salinum TaxID=2962673 RepID=UPI0020C9784F|nr:hypothetical protein [Haloglomus salinum]
MLVDIRAALVFFDVLTGPLHGPFHTFLGATLLGVVLIAVSLPVRPTLDSVLAWFRLPQEPSVTRIVAGACVGVWLHIVLDAILYADMAPLAPLSGNPLLGLIGVTAVYIASLVAGVLGVGLYVLAASGLVELLPQSTGR